jgi:GT2 family glycosyltransferase
MNSLVVLVLVWNGRPWLRACLSALRAQSYAGRYAVLVVDNGSTDGSPELVAAEFPEVALIRNQRNLGFGAGNNVGLRALRAGTAPAPADFRPAAVTLLNQDTVVEPGWLDAISAAFARHPQAAIVGCKILGPDGLLQHAGGQITWPTGAGSHQGAGERDEGRYDEERAVEWVTGAALALRGDLPAELALFDEGFHPAYFEDVELCYRARAAGYSVIYAPSARLIHHEHSALGAQTPAHQRAYHRSRVRFVLGHGPLAELEAFVAAEREEIARWNLADSLARKAAYLDALADLPAILAARAEPPPLAQPIRNALADLHLAVVAEERTRRAMAMQPAKQADPQAAPRSVGQGWPSPAEPGPPDPQEPMSTTSPETATPAPEAEPVEPVDVAAIMRQIRLQISERHEREGDQALTEAMRDVNERWDKVYAPLSLPPARSLPGRAWELLRVRLHQEVRAYLDQMIFRQTEFNGAVVRALNTLARRSDTPAASRELEALRDELIQLREQVRLLREGQA